MVFPSTKFQIYFENEPNSSWTLINALALVTAEFIFSLFLIIPAS